MAHELMNDTMMYVGELPWHKLGTQVQPGITSEEALKVAGLDWEVHKHETSLNILMDCTERTFKTGHYSTYRIVPDPNEPLNSDIVVLGNVGNRYEILQNKDAFRPFDEALKEFGYDYETAGAIHEGSRIWVLAKNGKATVGNDEVDKYMLLVNSHDGSTPVIIKPTPIRVVCNNTMNIALRKSDSISIRHTTNMANKMDEVVGALKNAEGEFDKAFEHMNKMVELKKFDIVKYFESIAPKLKDRRGEHVELTMSGRKRPDNNQKVFNSLMWNYENGMGNDGCSLWDAYNAVTEYVDHQKYADHGQWVHRTQFGQGNKMKVAAYKEAVSLVNEQIAPISSN